MWRGRQQHCWFVHSVASLVTFLPHHVYPHGTTWQQQILHNPNFLPFLPLKADSHIACRSLPCCAAKGLECAFPIWFTQCGRVWFTLVMQYSDHAVLLYATARPSFDGCAVALRRRAWSEHGMASVNQMGKTHSKPLAARHAICESAFSLLNPYHRSLTWPNNSKRLWGDTWQPSENLQRWKRLNLKTKSSCKALTDDHGFCFWY